jgi:glycosyltransferase involved in cell wall biosynthesis
VHVAIEALGIDRSGGPRPATLNVLEAVFAAENDIRYTVFLSQPEQRLIGLSQVRQVCAGSLSPLRARLWAQVVLPWFARRWRPDLVHHMKNLAVAGLPCPTVITVFDLTLMYHPEIYPWLDRVYWRYIQPRSLHAAAAIVAISHSTADDVRRFYRVDADKIRVIYPPVSARFAAAPGDPDAVRGRFRLSGDFILHVGSISRKKNLGTLLRAFQHVRQQGVDAKLVLVGREYTKGRDPEIFQFIRDNDLDSDVILTGSVTDDELIGLYRSATVAAFPSLHEGFGMFPLEAMAFGLPLISSASGALREVVGEGGWLLHDPTDDRELADALRQTLGNPQLRRSLREQGLRRATDFSPQVTRQQTLAIYRGLKAESRKTGPAR